MDEVLTITGDVDASVCLDVDTVEDLQSAASAEASTHAASLAVNAATTSCRLVLDTLADTKAPWRARNPKPLSFSFNLRPAC